MWKKPVLGLMMFAILFSWSAACAGEKCIMCGMDAAQSETKFTVQVTEGNEKVQAGGYSFCCLRCLLTFMRKMETGKVADIQARDYDSGKMFDASVGFFLVESEKLPSGSMVPFMLIFSVRETADRYQKTHGGRVLGWDDVRSYTEKYKMVSKQ
ncbi:MAG: nitrous oxide reductase accessory protein NosL [Syntrophobacteraceae bacterium]